MKKYLILFSLFIIGLSSCQKTNVNNEQATIDDAKIQAYIKANHITATKDPSGLYYQVITAGAATHPGSLSTVQLTYSSSYINGVTFDQVNVVSFQMINLIKGLQIGVPKIGVGGRIMLIIPSALVYGATAVNDIPANTILVYTVDLIGFY
jgi:FKBP-type peptidyl-prolyl cis-trans isomerase FkpA